VELYLIRPAEALPVGEDGIVGDEQRPLSEASRAQCRALSEALQRLGARFEKVVSSPLVRAKQTAELLLAGWPAPAPEMVECDALRPGGKRKELARFLQGLGTESAVVVGHNPDLSMFAAWLIGAREAQVELARGGVARIDTDGSPGKGAGTLAWALTPNLYEALPGPHERDRRIVSSTHNNTVAPEAGPAEDTADRNGLPAPAPSPAAGASAPAAEAPGPEAAATRVTRAEALVDSLPIRVAEMASYFGRHLARFAARLREEARDFWAEAQVLRKGKDQDREEKGQDKPFGRA
jgi:phosphohistidine phosphatase